MEATLRVVVVEDDPLLLFDLSGILRRGGHQVVASCATATEMVAAMRGHSPDVVVFDVHLHDEDGISAFRSVGREHPCAGVAVTGDRSAETERHAVSSEVFAFVLKPVNPVQLLTAVRLAAAWARNMNRLRSENEQLAATLDDPQGVVSRARAKLMRQISLTETGAHAFLIHHAKDKGFAVVRFAEMVLDNEFHIGVFCNLRKRGDSPPHNGRRSLAHQDGSE